MAETDPQSGNATGAEASPQSGRQASDVEQALDGAQASLNEVQQAMHEDAQAGQADGQQGDGAGHEQGTTWMPEATPRNSDGTPAGIELLGDVDLDVTIELGRTEMLVEDVLRLTSGSVVELDKLAGDPVDVYVNGRLVARGEVLRASTTISAFASARLSRTLKKRLRLLRSARNCRLSRPALPVQVSRRLAEDGNDDRFGGQGIRRQEVAGWRKRRTWPGGPNTCRDFSASMR